MTLHVEQGTAGVTVVDGGIGLDQVIIGGVLDIPIERADDASGNRYAQAKGISGCEHLIADVQRVAVAPLRRRKRVVNLHLDQRQVGDPRRVNGSARYNGAIIEFHSDFERVLDHMVVGHDQARWIDDEARTDEIPDLRIINLRLIFRTRHRRHRGRGRRLLELSDGNIDNRRQDTVQHIRDIRTYLRGMRRQADKPDRGEGDDRRFAH